MSDEDEVQLSPEELLSLVEGGKYFFYCRLK